MVVSGRRRIGRSGRDRPSRTALNADRGERRPDLEAAQRPGRGEPRRGGPRTRLVARTTRTWSLAMSSRTGSPAWASGLTDTSGRHRRATLALCRPSTRVSAVRTASARLSAHAATHRAASSSSARRRAHRRSSRESRSGAPRAPSSGGPPTRLGSSKGNSSSPTRWPAVRPTVGQRLGPSSPVMGVWLVRSKPAPGTSSWPSAGPPFGRSPGGVTSSCSSSTANCSPAPGHPSSRRSTRPAFSVAQRSTQSWSRTSSMPGGSRTGRASEGAPRRDRSRVG